MNIEVIASTPSDCSQVAESKASRIQLVSALEVGGLTPSYGLIRKSLEAAGSTPINIMIRPHSLSFCYTDSEIQAMIDDIQICQDFKVNGVVFGALHQDNTINTTHLQALLSHTNSLEVTFHKAFDQTPNLLESLQTLQKYQNITTILTQGGTTPLLSNTSLLHELVSNRKGKIILLGGGLKHSNILELYTQFQNNCQYHFGTAVQQSKKVKSDLINQLIS